MLNLCLYLKVEMKITLFTKNLEELKTNALVIGFYENFSIEDFNEHNELSEGFLHELTKGKEFTGKFGQISLIMLKGKIKKLIIIGLGKRDEFDINKSREIAGKASLFIREKNIKEFSFFMFEELPPFDSAYSIVEGIKLSLYKFNYYKTDSENKQILQVTLVANGNNFIDIDKGIRKAIIVSEAVNYIKDLQNKPSNILTPSYLADEAKRISKKYNLKCSILEKKDLEKLGMGGILAVNKGSIHPPKFIILEYGNSKETICFVGKGVTFDAGGISIKPAKDMDEMKFDMSGAAVVLGILTIASQLKLPYRIIGLMPTTENLPSGEAYKPGDIISHYNKKTSEIIDTDAEGRLILADALAYSKNFNPSVVIDFATLTGACVVSLGEVYTGLFSTDNLLSEKLIEAGNKTGEILWRLPLNPKYKDYIKSDIADLKNCGPRDAGAITAAVFLKEFVDCKKWAHLDIAGTASVKNSKEAIKPNGGTGVGVRLALEFLENWKK